MQSGLREALLIHALLAIAAVPLLLAGEPQAVGRGLLWLAAGYNLALPLVALVRGHAEWLWLWLFLLPLCVALVLPAWALSEVAGVLSFPDLGVWRIGGVVPVYCAGLWMMLLFPVLLAAGSGRRSSLIAGALALGATALAEWVAGPLMLWRSHGVGTLYGMAIYPLIPGLLLGLGALQAYRQLRNRAFVRRLAGALAVVLQYSGALFIALLLFEHW